MKSIRTNVRIEKMNQERLCSYVSNDFLDRSIIQEKLGEGTYGTVYRIRTHTGENYAVKYLPFDSDLRNVGVSQSGLLDSDLLVRLRNSPDIIKLIGICHSPGYLSLILEPMDSNLKMFIEKTPHHERIALLPHFLHTMFRTVALMETLNISHFDLKPQNILVRRVVHDGSHIHDSAHMHDVDFKITDFGLSRASIGNYHVPKTELFSLWYRPPEYLSERPRNTFRILSGDVWSIGLTALEFIIGMPIFVAQSNKGILRLIYGSSIIPTMTNRVFDNANSNGTISGNLDVRKLIQTRAPSIDIPDKMIEIISQTMILNPDHRPTGIQLLSLFKDTISPTFLSSLFPEPVSHRVDSRSIGIIVRMGYSIRVSLATIIISIEIFTRYLDHHVNTNMSLDIFALAAFRIGSTYNEDKPPLTETIRETYVQKYNQFLMTSNEIASAEKIILNHLQYRIYNMNLGPVIIRAYEQSIDFDHYNFDLLSNSLEHWFTC